MHPPVALLNGPHETTWANLGLWRNADGYPGAAAALATRVGRAAQLDGATRLLDVGVGAGEQLAHWVRYFDVPGIVGVELDPGLAHRAHERVARCGLGSRVRIEVGEAGALEPSRLEAWGAFDALVALDCAYHFHPRHAFLMSAARALRPGGRLALTDLVLAHETTDLNRLARWVGIPPAGLATGEAYGRELAAAGFTAPVIEDLTPDVLGGFTRWAAGRAASLLVRGGTAGLGVVATAAAGAWARRRGLRYVLVAATRTDAAVDP